MEGGAKPLRWPTGLGAQLPTTSPTELKLSCSPLSEITSLRKLQQKTGKATIVLLDKNPCPPRGGGVFWSVTPLKVLIFTIKVYNNHSVKGPTFNFYSVQRLVQVSIFKHRISCTPKVHFVPICAHCIQRTNGVSSMSSNATFNSRVPLVASRSLFFASATRLSQKCANRVDLENAAL